MKNVLLVFTGIFVMLFSTLAVAQFEQPSGFENGFDGGTGTPAGMPGYGPQGFGPSPAMPGIGTDFNPQVRTLPPEFHDRMPVEEILMQELGARVLSVYTIEQLEAMCPAPPLSIADKERAMQEIETNIVDKIAGLFTAEDISGVCEEFDERYEEYSEAREMCEGIEMQGGPSGPFGIQIECPANSAGLKLSEIKEALSGTFIQACKEQATSEREKQLEKELQRAQQECQRNLRFVQNDCQRMQWEEQQWQQAGQWQPLSQQPFQPQQPQPSTGGGCASIGAPSDEFNEKCMQERGTIRNKLDATGCHIGYSCSGTSIPDDIQVGARCKDISVEEQNCRNQGKQPSYGTDSLGCRFVSSCTLIEQPPATEEGCQTYCEKQPHVTCVGRWEIQGTVTPNCSCNFVCEETIPPESQCGNGIVESREDCASCPADVRCTEGQECKQGVCAIIPTCPDIQQQVNDCTARGGIPVYSTDNAGCQVMSECQTQTLATAGSLNLPFGINLQEPFGALGEGFGTSEEGFGMPGQGFGGEGFVPPENGFGGMPDEMPGFGPGPAPFGGSMRCDMDWRAEDYCGNESSFVPDCVEKRKQCWNQSNTDDQTGKFCDFMAKQTAFQFAKFCKETTRGKEKCLKHVEIALQFAQKQQEACRQMASMENLREIVREKAVEMCRFKWINEKRKSFIGIDEKFIDLLQKLNQSEGYVAGDLLPWLRGEKARVSEVAEGVQELNDEQSQRGILYALTQLLGQQAEREKADAQRIREQVAKLEETIQSLQTLAEQVENEQAKLVLRAQVQELQQRKTELEQTAQSKEAGAGGIFGFLFGGGK